MAKNKDTKNVNRTGVLSMKDMTITYKDKDNTTIFNLEALLQEFDGEQFSITMSSDFNPSHVLEETE
ncbi:YonK family protein [Paenibacillus sp. QZ-Y1]|uniref:YonK family protein n=1 Tax=Paenibacillus sp. QZ-Y1 TaxID=3414511 RepID=UPI003F793245